MIHLVTTAPIASIHMEPRFRSEMVTQSLLGEIMKGSASENQWYNVTLRDGYQGYVYHFYVRELPEKEIKEWNDPNLMVSALWSRAYDPESKKVILTLPSNSRLILEEEKKMKYLVSLPDTRKALVDAEEVLRKDHFPLPLEPMALAATAERYLGCPYLWGGRSCWGLDCSGFVQLVFDFHGLLLPRDAHPQFESPLAAKYDGDPSRLGAGHLYFFSENKARMTHVAISLGNGKFIHSSGCVKINSLNPNDPDYSERLKALYAGAKTIDYSAKKNGNTIESE
jgi:gamma-D-glutamyl-L-lysine dipeptidyl-peptidase